MDPTLTRHVQPPTPRTRILVFWAIGTATLAAALATVSVPLVLIALTPDIELPAGDEIAVAAAEPAAIQGPVEPPPVAVVARAVPKASHADLSFIAHAGGRHFAILDRIEMPSPYERAQVSKFPYPKNTQLLGESDYPGGAVIPLNGASVPEAVGAWRGQRIVVDGTCETRITDIVRLSLLNGSPDYAVGSAEGKEAMRDYAVNYGSHYYAAEIHDCIDGSWLRHAEMSPAQLAIESAADSRITAKAKRDLVRSDLGRAASARWKEAGQKGRWDEDSDMGATFMTQTARHPTTGQRWLVVHARADYGCGGVDINLLGIYRVEGDAVVRHLLKEAGELISIDKLVDVDGDGAFELIGTSYLDGPAITDDQGTIRYKMEIPFYGCPC